MVDNISIDILFHILQGKRKPMKNRPPLKLFHTNQFLLFILLLFAILYFGRSFLIPIIMGSLFAMLLAPLTLRLEKWHFPRVLAATLTVLISVGVVMAIFSVLINQLILLGDDLSAMENRLPGLLEKTYDYISETFALTKEQQETYIKNQLNLASGRITNMVTMILRSLGMYLFNFVIVITYAILLLIYRDQLKNFVLQLVEKNNSKRVEHAAGIIDKTTNVASSYIAGMMIVVLILTVANIIALSVIGVEHALFFGLAAGLLNLIPYVGMVSGSAFPVIYAFLTHDTASVAVITLIYFVVIQHVEAYILTPNITGAKVELSPLATIVALFMGGFVWGIAGMVVFVPILGIAKVVFDNVEELQPYGYLIGIRKK